MTHCRYITLSLSKIRIHSKKRREQYKHSCRFRCVLNISFILLNPNSSSTSQFLDSACFSSDDSCLRFVTIILNECAETKIAVCTRGMKSIIFSICVLGEVKGLAIGIDISEINYLLNFLRLWVCIDMNIVDIAWNERLEVLLGD